MQLQDKFKVGSWLTSKQGQAFNWGTWDCNIFFVELHDMLYGTTDLDRVHRKYQDRRSGVRVLREIGTPAQWLHFKNYKKKTSSHPKWRDGDIATIDQRLYYSVYFYFDGAFWTVPEEGQLTGYTPASVENVMTAWWRK